MGRGAEGEELCGGRAVGFDAVKARDFGGGRGRGFCGRARLEEVRDWKCNLLMTACYGGRGVPGVRVQRMRIVVV